MYVNFSFLGYVYVFFCFKVIDLVKSGATPPVELLTSEVPQGVVEVMALCWAASPLKRPSFKEVDKRISFQLFLLIKAYIYSAACYIEGTF